MGKAFVFSESLRPLWSSFCFKTPPNGYAAERSSLMPVCVGAARWWWLDLRVTHFVIWWRKDFTHVRFCVPRLHAVAQCRASRHLSKVTGNSSSATDSQCTVCKTQPRGCMFLAKWFAQFSSRSTIISWECCFILLGEIWLVFFFFF